MARYDGPYGPADGHPSYYVPGQGNEPYYVPGQGNEPPATAEPQPPVAPDQPPRAAPSSPPPRGRIYYPAGRHPAGPPMPAAPGAGIPPERGTGGPPQAYPPPAAYPAPPAYPSPAHPLPPGYAPPGPPPAGGPAPGSGRRAALVVALASLLALGLVGAGVVVVRPGPVRGWFDSAAATPSASPPADAVPSPVLAAAGADAPAPTAAGIAAALDPLLRDPRLGAPVAASVTDVLTGESLYVRGADVPTTPASTTKLVTAVAVLATRGAAYRIPTMAVAGAGAGEVVLVGGGDPTLSAGAGGSYPGAGRLDDLARQVTQALGGVAPIRVSFDVSRFSGPAYGPGWDPDIATGGYAGPVTALMTDAGRVDPKDTKGPALRHAAPDLATAQAFARALGLPATAVTRGRAPGKPGPGAATPGTAPATTAEGTTPGPGASGPAVATTPPAPGTPLGTVYSAPLVRLVEIMLAESDNVVAEALARQVALAKGAPASFAGAAAAVATVLGELGLPVAESTLFDGSGLSRLNRLTPSLLTDVVALAARADRPELHSIFSGLPVAGYSGTLRDRYRTAAPVRPGVGTVRAKTGTLSGISAIAGIVVTRDGRLLAFAVLADRVPVGQFPAQDAIDRIAAVLAGCGCRT
ncbi:MAG TPA: D-alanyl-D-alanine carboxypeptidase/D-alanyl-D-alanine-endopeptidase [Micromonosporaceae bacterium]|nr:D-alanyl-D-alanine carboxypeptidase/D-alanyl-D-alanine-endopeptidase [Micromonosporaceae bacterium]